MIRLVNRGVTVILSGLGIVLLAMVALSLWNVFARHVLGSALLWADEVATFAMVALAWIGAGACAWRGKDIRMDVGLLMLPDGIQRIVRICHQIVIAGLCGWVAWLSYAYVARLAAVGMKSNGARLPLWTVHGCITIGAAFLVMVALIRLWRLLQTGSEDLTT
jgi:TRAP-type C4-dicarboxylate transport system permease small subunit